MNGPGSDLGWWVGLSPLPGTFAPTSQLSAPVGNNFSESWRATCCMPCVSQKVVEDVPGANSGLYAPAAGDMVTVGGKGNIWHGEKGVVSVGRMVVR